MQPIDPLRASWTLHSLSSTRSVEHAAGASLPEHTLMRRAGEAVARLALAVAPHARHVCVAAGPGNNGGDGLEAAIHLKAAGRTVRVGLLGAVDRLPCDAADALARAQAAGVVVAPGLDALRGEQELVIDAVLGIGANRAPEGELAAAIDAMQAHAGRVLSVDTPSGLNAFTGQALGDGAVLAAHTLCLLTLKPGLFTAAGRDHAGSVWFDDLGVDASHEPGVAMLIGGPTYRTRVARQHSQHKGSFGDVQVVGGAPGMVGAAVLAARAALASGAGRVYVALLDAGAPGMDPAHPELMFRRGALQGTAPERVDGVVVCGCGGGEAVRSALPPLLSNASRLVLDADALNAIAADPVLQHLLRARGARGRPTVLTPHPLEAARLLGCSAGEVQSDRIGAAVQLAQSLDSVVVLKGSGTVIATRGSLPAINPTGNAALSTAGTGDVLAGWLGGEWAQAADSSSGCARLVAARSVFRHGLAAHGAAPPLQATRLIERMQALG